MYIIKNALRNIRRSFVRNLLIGIIIFIIGFSACISLSIRQAAISAKEKGIEALDISANITFSRQQAMEDFNPESGEKPSFHMEELSLEEQKTYAKSKNVKDFYVEETLSLNGNDALSAVSNTQDENDEGRTFAIGGPGGSLVSGDFTISGFSNAKAMTSFGSGTNKITEGDLFGGKSNDEVVISKELATLNNLKVGDTITLQNPSKETETFKFKIVGLFKNNSSDGMFSPMDPANQIFMSSTATENIVTTSKTNTENTGETKITSFIIGTYTFQDVTSYEAFKKEVTKLGLSDNFEVVSGDVEMYEQSLAPLNSLANFASTFLIVVLVVGGAILVIFNILRIKERSYEIGVLSAIGMNKVRVSFQFLCELFTITFAAIVLAITLGSFTSVPITNSLLANEASTSNEQRMEPGKAMIAFSGNIETIDEVDEAIDLEVILQLFGVALILTILSGSVSLISILRYNPLQILSDRN